MPENAAGPTRREEQRAKTYVEILNTARELLVADGSAAITLRAIAREMRMAPTALYRYYPSLNDLLISLVESFYAEITDKLRKACDAVPEGPLQAGYRVIVACREFRDWAINHQNEFILVFGRPIPSLSDLKHAEDAGEEFESGRQFGGFFLGVFLAVWASKPFPVPAEDQMEPGLAAQLRDYAAGINIDIPVGTVHEFLYCWTRLFGILTMEVTGHLNFALSNVEPMFEEMLAECAERLNLPAQVLGRTSLIPGDGDRNGDVQ
ncbi:MAG: TetR/AcrR family transcriptional regulator, partial [Corynebacteriales bacterium]|nr:TetR/AcrR family transcriptional regulator [Mycobacteriales bacterium]